MKPGDLVRDKKVSNPRERNLLYILIDFYSDRKWVFILSPDGTMWIRDSEYLEVLSKTG